MAQIGYINYLVGTFILSGIFLLRYDTGTYRVAKMKRELKWARFAGWSNIVLGIVTFGANWVYENFFW
ncbi:CLC_0170 family protein [Peribacillus glennii]|uniref:Uncharacterized protein n=1 Tax=Peribacillus glennii TaxID=2303991 RepID=A0A372LLN7_9BACI|nr:CLC_0170 family protein [Peribacillus glennii]RFU66693.1 hypothetical protein D0466_00845 [Peribacillus glennii]